MLTTLRETFCLHRKFLIYNMVSRNLKTKYRRSFFGILWTLLNPMATAGIYFFVFRVVLKVDQPHYLAFILSGVLFWSFFSSGIVEGMESLVSNFGLLTKVPIPIQIFPFAGALTNVVTLFLSMPIILAAALISGVHLAPPMLLLAYYALVLLVMSYSITVIVSILYVFFRDLRHIMGIVLQLWFYATPIVYGENRIPEAYHWILYANPVALAVSGIHRIMTLAQWPTAAEIGVPALWAVGLLAFMMGFKALTQRDIVENL